MSKNHWIMLEDLSRPLKNRFLNDSIPPLSPLQKKVLGVAGVAVAIDGSTCLCAQRRDPSGGGSWTNWKPAWWWVRWLRPVPASLAAMGKDCARTTRAAPSATSPWSNTMFPLRPRWCAAAGTCAAPGTCLRPLVDGPATSQLRCSAPSATVPWMPFKFTDY